MNGNKTILQVLEVIHEKSLLTPKNESVSINQTVFSELGLDIDEVVTTMGFLQDDEHCIHITALPQKRQGPLPTTVLKTIRLFSQATLSGDYSFRVRLEPKFASVLDSYRKKVKTPSATTSILSPPIKSIDKFSIHEDGTVSFNGTKVALEPKQQKICHLLIESHPMVATITTLVDNYWDDEIEHEAAFLDRADFATKRKNLHDCISKLRKILSSLDGKEHVETLRNTGYKFIP